MSDSPSIVLFHVHKDAMNAAVSAFEHDWPEAQISNILEDGLFAWVRETGGIVPEMYDAFHRLMDTSKLEYLSANFSASFFPVPLNARLDSAHAESFLTAFGTT